MTPHARFMSKSSACIRPRPTATAKSALAKAGCAGPSSCQPSCEGAHIFFLVNVSRKNTMTKWSPPDRTTRKPPGGSPRCVCAMPSAKGHNGLVSVPKPACAKPARRGTRTRRRICTQHVRARCLKRGRPVLTFRIFAKSVHSSPCLGWEWALQTKGNRET